MSPLVLLDELIVNEKRSCLKVQLPEVPIGALELPTYDQPVEWGGVGQVTL